MIRLPVFESLDVDGYGMFPGTPSKPGLHIQFHGGLTLVLGANGLGKSTLVTLLYRMCTGPFEVPGLATPGVLGTARTEATRLQRPGQRVLAARVADDAAQARATVVFALGTSRIEVSRELSNLSVAALKCDGEDLQPSDDRFQDLVRGQSGLPKFGDWILLLHYLVFYFEDRRALVWDPTAQRQVLRLLMLPKTTAATWEGKEREVLELDSRVRNLQAALNREEGAERRAKAKASDAKTVRGEIERLESEIVPLTARLQEVNLRLPGTHAERQRARLRALTAEQARDSDYRELERLQLERIAEAFPSHTETARYLISRLLSTEVCQTCGSHVPDFAAELESRLAASKCVVCASRLSAPPASRSDLAALIDSKVRRLERLGIALEAARIAREEAETAYTTDIFELRSLENGIAQRRAKVAALVRQLPPDERKLRQQSAEVSALRGRLESLRDQLAQRRSAFEVLVRHDMMTIAERRSAVIEVFQEYAQGFLFESCQLKWQPKKDRVGQTGPLVDFPAFEFEMTGSDFPSAVRRSEPQEVSESQREFIDLAFRMTLMKVASDGGVGSLVIDAPETSLDAVFSKRAADVLLKFANPSSNNRLMITSNLVDGQLIPEILREAGIKSARSRRILDLLEIATPTAAIRNLASEYRAVRDRLFARATEGE